MSENKTSIKASVVESASIETNSQPIRVETLQVEAEPLTEYVYNRDYRFWCIIISLCTMQILRSLENTVVVTSLPTIVKELSLGSSYIWVTNIFFLTTPRRLFANRTSIIIYINTFIISLLNYWIFFFLPFYFQAVRLSTPTRSGVQILPITLIAIPGAAIGALALSKWGKYKYLHIVGFALLAAGVGFFSILNNSVYFYIKKVGSTTKHREK